MLYINNEDEKRLQLKYKSSHLDKHEKIEQKSQKIMDKNFEVAKLQLDSETDGSSGATSSDMETDSESELMKTPKKKARPWRGAKTPTKTPMKTPSKKVILTSGTFKGGISFYQFFREMLHLSTRQNRRLLGLYCRK